MLRDRPSISSAVSMIGAFGEKFMKPPRNAWSSKTEGRLVLLFAQTLHEMLAEPPFESFRVYSLDTVSRLSEALALMRDVQLNRVPRASLKPVLEEVLWSFEKDPIAKSVAPNEISVLSEGIKQEAILADLAANIRVIARLLKRDYKLRIERYLLAIFDEPNRKLDLRRACGFYCSHLVNSGFSKNWIREIVQELFFDPDMSDADRNSVETFFRKLDTKDVEFNVFSPVNSELARLLKSLGWQVMDWEELGDHARESLQPYFVSELNSVVVSVEKANDPYGSVDLVQSQLTYVRALTYLGREGMDCRWNPWMYVSRKADGSGKAYSVPELSFDRPPRLTAGRRLRSHTKFFKRLMENFDRPSTERLLSSVNTAALARGSANTENQLISLWSAIEVLLSDPHPGMPRVISYVHQIVPCICLRHVRRQFVAIYDELLVAYRRSFVTILRQEPSFREEDPHTNFAALICLQENEPLQKELCRLCADNPLALQRLFKLNRDYGTVNAAANAIDAHEKRVSWQVHRIYRARNQLVHLGRKPPYLDPLILNMAEYFQASISAIVSRAQRESGQSNIDRVVSEIGVAYRILLRRLSKSDTRSMNRADLHQLVARPSE
ncbi:hypothetical protein [Rhodopseudomonas sp. AAP120]|uniref:hypothetical protein n=1 Tax=Rhodopseudomonas sp. AAP120 TaxID=1523430 RepID=UPI0012E0E4AF|nr:hypothetical protein [Rhodopseudomonas sp. AAP120]